MTAPFAATAARGEDVPPVLGPFARYSPYAWLLPQELWPRPKREAWYTIDFVTPQQLPAAGTRTLTVGVERDSVFACIEVAAATYNVDDTTIIPLPSLTVDVRDAGSQLTWFDRPLHYQVLFNVGLGGGLGTGNSRLLTLPRLVDPGGVMSVTLVNFDAVARHVRFSFHGFRVWL